MDTRSNLGYSCPLRYQATVADVLTELGIAQTKSDARRFVLMGAVTVDGQKVTDHTEIIDPESWVGRDVRVLGKRLEFPVALSLIQQMSLA
jgi:tyrosyl-tRNA synthetase